MRFFTDEKYQNGSAFTEYESYCKSIWPQVPIGLRQISKDMLPSEFDSDMVYGLHDARIIKFECDEQANEIFIYFSIFDEEDNEYRLKGTYKDAKCILQPSVTFIGDDRDCDIMCHEVIYEKKRFSHTILFASGEELIIEFSTFELEVMKQ